MKNQQLHHLLDYWSKLTHGSVNRQIFGAAIAVAIGTALVKGVAVVKELVVAWKFGVSDDLDAFLIALLIPSFIINVVAGAVPAALIPTYIQVREQEGQKASQKLFSGIIVWSLALLGITTILMLVFAPFYLPLIAIGFSPEKLNLTFKLLCTMAPIVLLSGIIIIWSSVLNAGEKFVLASLSPASTSIITIGFLLAFSSLGSFALVAGLAGGAVLEILILGVALHRQGISLRPKWHGFERHLRQVAGQYMPMIAGSFLMCSTALVDQSMAAMLSPGSVAALNYGNRVIALPITLATTALSAAVIPYFSKMVAHQDWKGVRHTLQHYLKIIFIITVPLALLFIFFSEQIIALLFQRGSFTVDDTKVVANIQLYFAFQIPFYVANILVVRLISAMQLNQILMQVSGVNLIINVVLNYVFMQLMGISGIALSTSCVYIFCFVYMLINANLRLRQHS
ncbi:MAG: murein biosynthesis integral membrane protein MurJ [Goleter apudmare HA4340-LM2]|jgi:putative peptidoglycan lipid II flippase|nr:murein biosynthesis integral membrane protein MurJ [Goleter apudmare HA4340-LM2]